MTGRPVYSDELAETICQRIASGEGLRAICRDDDMPGRQTVLDWLNDDSKAAFRARYTRARESQADWWDEEMHNEALAAEPETVQVARLRIDTMKWRASKLAPKKYGDKVDATIGNPDGSSMQERSAREIAMAVLAVVRRAQDEPAS